MKGSTGFLLGAAAVVGVFVYGYAGGFEPSTPRVPPRKLPPRLPRPEPVGQVRGPAAGLVAKLQGLGFRRDTFWEGSDAVPVQTQREFAQQMGDRARAMRLAPGEAIAAHMPEAQNIIALADARGVDIWWRR